eukprot:TRINITY_DN12638_c0_g1_i1.p1 TRINITY_DN12638_c0_g1~~TRINITY_DN12638_c0_g1_i1.p1  ORF type:complete len:328 (-),score=49.12 TRINITY_DN12638_c0_g1_i1:56-988(-)
MDDYPHETTPFDLFKRLKCEKPKIIDGLEGLYEFPPFLPKSDWLSVGDSMVRHEHLESFNVPGNKYISLRLDGHGFSRLTRRLKHDGVLEPGFSPTMASWMQHCCVSLMDFVNAKYGYTQSDEITVIILPAPVTVKGQQPHMFNGRVVKICSLAASHVTLTFNHCFSKQCENWQSYICTFDCRMGCYDTLEEALTLILWRAYDCGVNSLSDACYHQKGRIEGAKTAVGTSSRKKLEFLHQHNLLPLADHQAHGSYYVRVRRNKVCKNPNTDEKVLVLRSVFEKIEGNVLNLAASDRLTLVDDLPVSQSTP